MRSHTLRAFQSHKRLILRAKRSRVHHFVNQYIRSFRKPNQILGGPGIPREDNGVSFEVDPVAECWLHKTMVDGKGRYLDSRVFISLPARCL